LKKAFLRQILDKDYIVRSEINNDKINLKKK